MLRRRSREQEPEAEELEVPVDAAAAAVDELRQAVTELRDALTGPAAPVMLQLRRLEQRIGRLEDLAAINGTGSAGATESETATPATEPVQTPATPAPSAADQSVKPEPVSIDRALEDDQRRTGKAEIAAQKLARSGIWIESSRFIETADNPNVGMIGDLGSGGPVALVHVVEGGKGAIPPPSVLFSAIPVDMARRLVLRDVHRSWLHRGLPGAGGSPPEVADAVREALAEHDQTPVVVIGAGFAGFGAILLGALLDAALIVAIDAPTSMEPEMLKALGDDRWEEELAVLEARQAASDEHIDLLAVLRDSAVPVEIHYGKADRLQRRHAERLRGLDTVTLRAHDVEGSLLPHLTEGRALAKLVRRAIGSQGRG